MWLEVEVVLVIAWCQGCCIWLCRLFTVQLYGHHRFMFVIIILLSISHLLLPFHSSHFFTLLCVQEIDLYELSQWLLVGFRENHRVKGMWGGSMSSPDSLCRVTIGCPHPYTEGHNSCQTALSIQLPFSGL